MLPTVLGHTERWFAQHGLVALHFYGVAFCPHQNRPRNVEDAISLVR